MAAAKVDIASQCANLVKDIRNGIFAPVYLLMGDEPYYPEMICSEILENCIDGFGKDFNETVCYGADVTSEQIITAARRFPMMADRQLVVVKEAQMLKDIEQLSLYCADPLDSTVLVILMYKSGADKRKSLYKSVQKCGVVVDSPALKDYEISGWISRYFQSKGLNIHPDAARLMGESAGTDLSTIVAETEKMQKNLPEGTTDVSVADVEANVGISRQFSIFELTNALSFRNASKALLIASHIGNSARFAMPAATSALFLHFNRILKYGALLSRGGNPSPEEKGRALQGVSPYFYREYDTAVRNYPLAKAMAAVSLLCEYDYLGKGGDGAATAPGDLLVELTLKLLNL